MSKYSQAINLELDQGVRRDVWKRIYKFSRSARVNAMRMKPKRKAKGKAVKKS